MTTVSNPRARASARAMARTSATSLPELSWATPRRAWTRGPVAVSRTMVRPARLDLMDTASRGQTAWQTPHPSQDSGSTLACNPSAKLMARNRHEELQRSQPSQSSGSTSAR